MSLITISFEGKINSVGPAATTLKNKLPSSKDVKYRNISYKTTQTIHVKAWSRLLDYI